MVRTLAAAEDSAQDSQAARATAAGTPLLRVAARAMAALTDDHKSFYQLVLTRQEITPMAMTVAKTAFQNSVLVFWASDDDRQAAIARAEMETAPTSAESPRGSRRAGVLRESRDIVGVDSPDPAAPAPAPAPSAATGGGAQPSASEAQLRADLEALQRSLDERTRQATTDAAAASQQLQQQQLQIQRMQSQMQQQSASLPPSSLAGRFGAAAAGTSQPGGSSLIGLFGAPRPPPGAPQRRPRAAQDDAALARS